MTMTKFPVLLCLLVLTSCASDPKYLAKAESVFGSNKACIDYVQNTGQFGFNHIANSPLGKVSVSVSVDNNGSVCGFSTNNATDLNDFGASWDQLEQMSVARCEKSRKLTAIKSTCRPFSRNHEVVWGRISEDAK